MVGLGLLVELREEKIFSSTEDAMGVCVMDELMSKNSRETENHTHTHTHTLI